MSLLNFHTTPALLHRPLLSPAEKPLISPVTTTRSIHLKNGGVRAPISTKASPERSSRTPTSSSTLEAGDGELTASSPTLSASEVVKSFYDEINRRNLPAVDGLIADNCVYEDLIFPQPFVGRKDIMEFFGKFSELSKDLQFVIDDISSEDTSAIGVKWHFEYKGTPFPFSKGCSFYRLEVFNGTRQIVYARDSVEPAIKPGESALVIIKGVTWVLERFPQLVKWL